LFVFKGAYEVVYQIKGVSRFYFIYIKKASRLREASYVFKVSPPGGDLEGA
jgi:hypothetical protein